MEQAFSGADRPQPGPARSEDHQDHRRMQASSEKSTAEPSGRPNGKVAVERPTYDLTIFKLHCGKLTLKIYTKGERVPSHRGGCS